MLVFTGGKTFFRKDAISTDDSFSRIQGISLLVYLFLSWYEKYDKRSDGYKKSYYNIGHIWPYAVEDPAVWLYKFPYFIHDKCTIFSWFPKESRLIFPSEHHSYEAEKKNDIEKRFHMNKIIEYS